MFFKGILVMTIKYIGRHERVQNRELLNQI